MRLALGIGLVCLNSPMWMHLRLAMVGYFSDVTVLRRMPIAFDSTSTTSPGLSQSGGIKRAPAPVGVPVEVGELEVPIARVYPLERVRDAYGELEQGHTRGKIVLAL